MTARFWTPQGDEYKKIFRNTGLAVKGVRIRGGGRLIGRLSILGDADSGILGVRAVGAGTGMSYGGAWELKIDSYLSLTFFTW